MEGKKFERDFAKYLKGEGILFHQLEANSARNGSWPDFLVLGAMGKLVLFELKTTEIEYQVKDVKKLLRHSQRKTNKDLVKSNVRVIVVVKYLVDNTLQFFDLTNKRNWTSLELGGENSVKSILNYK